jgi:small GTP-binding protein
MNSLVGEKLSIVTPKPQTTRKPVLGICTFDNVQIVFKDTPGILQPKYELQRSMMGYVEEAIEDSDILAVIIEIIPKVTAEEYLPPDFIDALKNIKKPRVLIINKIDLLKNVKEVLPLMDKFNRMGIFARHFYLVSRIENSQPVRHERALLALSIMLAMILVASFEKMSMLEAGMLAAGAMIVTRCCTGAVARRSVDWNVLIAIAASLAIGEAIESTGVAKVVAGQLIGLASGSPWWTLVAVYGVALLLTELVTNNAAAVLVFPIAMQTAAKLGVSYMPFAMAVAVAASYGFATPMGYQTHLMVYGPGGYRFSDFFKIGITLDVLCWVVAVAIIHFVFPF